MDAYVDSGCASTVIRSGQKMPSRFGSPLPTYSERTVVRGGRSFYDKIPLNIGATNNIRIKASRPSCLTASRCDGLRLFRNTTPAGGVQTRTVWRLMSDDHQITARLLLRVGYEERHTHRDFFVEPVSLAPASNGGVLLLQDNGRSHYREFQTLARFRLQERRNIFLSYVRSEARGYLNDFNTYFGNLRNPVIRPNEFGKQQFDAPNRLLFWGEFGLRYDIVATPVVEWRSGFPFSLLDEDQNFVGPRNDGGRFPRLMTFDLLVTKGIKIPFRGKKYKGRVGVTIFNITNHWNPRDVQNNLASPQFTRFTIVPTGVSGLSLSL